ncbi:OsmC family protein [Pseudodesulfovibrio sp.]|uniref:OsmC family protein n=1 Tax=Pseudodesulfovibrio sp. TaxID=2035812 RepID=UPI00261720C1|nr:OsmC family protein [Pseudodesulfovibrio sp.]MDD3311873.1 OsmC family protein [Pseudodesulfovibrio sp.]
MITAKSNPADYLTEFTDGSHTGVCDAPSRLGGGDAGFTPYSLLEASLAACLNMTLRVYAKNHGIALGDVETSVTLVPDGEGHLFQYRVKLPEGLDSQVEKRLLAALKGCPVHGILSKPLAFERQEN